MSDRSIQRYNENSTLGTSAAPFAEIHGVLVYENGTRVATLVSPAFTGTPTAPTASSGTSTTQLATTAFVQQELATLGDLAAKDTVASADIDDSAVTLAKLADLAQDRLIGRISTGSGAPEALTPAQARTLLNVEDGAAADQTGAEIVALLNTELGSSGWQGSGGASDLDSLSDVTLTSLDNGEVLLSSSGSFINRTLAEANIAAASDLSTHEALSSAHGLGGDIVGTTDSQTLTGKTINGASNTLTVRLASDVTGDLPLANIAPASAASKLLGRGSASGAGDFEEITLGSGLTMTGTTLSASASAPALADVTDVSITSASDHDILGFDNSSGEWINQTAADLGLLTGSSNLADLADVGPTAASTNDVLYWQGSYFTVGSLASIGGVTAASTTTLTNKTISGASNTLTVRLANDVTGDLPFANLTPATAASKLLGRGSASGAGDFEEITLGTGLSMSGTTLSASASAPALADVTDVTITSVGTGEVLLYTGSGWENQTLAEADIAAASDFSNVENTSLSTWAGTANLTTLGTIGTGVWNGTAIADAYIASAATWDAKQDALTFGIADTNAVQIDSASVADNDFAKFTASGLEGRSYAEVKADLSLDNVENTALSTWDGTSNLVTTGTVTTGTWGADLAAGTVDAIGEIDASLRSGSDTTLVTGTAGTSGNLLQWNGDGDAIDSAIAAADVATEDYVDTRPFWVEFALTTSGADIATGTKVAMYTHKVAGTVTAMTITCDPADEPSISAVQVDMNSVNTTTGAATSELSSVAQINTGANTGTGTIDGTYSVSVGDRTSFDIDQGSDGKELYVQIQITPSAS